MSREGGGGGEYQQDFQQGNQNVCSHANQMSGNVRECSLHSWMPFPWNMLTEQLPNHFPFTHSLQHTHTHRAFTECTVMWMHTSSHTCLHIQAATTERNRTCTGVTCVQRVYAWSSHSTRKGETPPCVRLYLLAQIIGLLISHSHTHTCRTS